MKVYTKTYTARGLLEWQLLLKAEGAVLAVTFSGGTMGSNGVIGGRYTTDNPAIQRLIEQSPHFKSGRIALLKQV